MTAALDWTSFARAEASMAETNAFVRPSSETALRLPVSRDRAGFLELTRSRASLGTRM